MKRNPITLITGAVLVVLFLFMLFTYQVRQTEVVVVTTFGRFSRSETEPGFRWRWPWPIEKVYEFDNRLQNFQSKFDQSITLDQINLLAQVFVGWKIAEPRVFLERFNGDLQEAERILEPIVRNAKSEVIGQRQFSDLISTNVTALKFDEIEQEMLDRIRQQSEQTYGVRIELVGLRRIGLPESITTSVFERMRAERQRLVASYESEGQREAKIIRARADVEANEILAAANEQATKIEGEAEVSAQESYRVFEQNPELAVFLFQLRALEDSLKERTHLILDQQTPPFNLLGSEAVNTSGKSR